VATERQFPKYETSTLKISNAGNAAQAALPIKPTEMVFLARISCIGRFSNPGNGAHDAAPGPVAVGELPVPHLSDHQVRCGLLAAI
jgi:hypothetical protein